MPCVKSLNMTFDVYEVYPDGKDYDTGKSFSISKKENDDIVSKFGWIPSISTLDNIGIQLIMFDKLYGFTVGPNGFSLIWDLDKDGKPLTFISGRLYWPGPISHNACKIGGDWWKLKRRI